MAMTTHKHFLSKTKKKTDEKSSNCNLSFLNRKTIVCLSKTIIMFTANQSIVLAAGILYFSIKHTQINSKSFIERRSFCCMSYKEGHVIEGEQTKANVKLHKKQKFSKVALRVLCFTIILLILFTSLYNY